MIYYRKKNIFESGADALVNPVNCVGVMGRGLALQFKKEFPENFKEYKNACDHKLVNVGRMFITKLDGRMIINFPTKIHWIHKSKIEYIRDGLIDLHNKMYHYEINSVAMPRIGCDLGGLNWHYVESLIIEEFKHDYFLKIFIYEPINHERIS